MEMLRIGYISKEYGKLVAIGFVGERYYWFIKNKVVSMIPASVIEEMEKENNNE
jgi:hypothetical protein